jgi:hypothetical protein
MALLELDGLWSSPGIAREIASPCGILASSSSKWMSLPLQRGLCSAEVFMQAGNCSLPSLSPLGLPGHGQSSLISPVPFS